MTDTADAKARELWSKLYDGILRSGNENIAILSAALRAVEVETLERAAKVAEDCGRTNVENPAIDMGERLRRSGIRWCGEWAAQRIRSLATEPRKNGS